VSSILSVSRPNVPTVALLRRSAELQTQSLIQMTSCLASDASSELEMRGIDNVTRNTAAPTPRLD